MVLRRGTGGYLTNGIVARWQGQGISVRDPETNALLTADSLSVVNMLLAENTANYDADGSGNFGLESVFAADNHVQSSRPGRLAVHQPHGRRALDWTPPAGSPRQSGAGTVAIPTEYTGQLLRRDDAEHHYFGAADPAGSQVVGGLDQLRHAVIHRVTSRAGGAQDGSARPPYSPVMD